MNSRANTECIWKQTKEGFLSLSSGFGTIHILLRAVLRDHPRGWERGSKSVMCKANKCPPHCTVSQAHNFFVEVSGVCSTRDWVHSLTHKAEVLYSWPARKIKEQFYFILSLHVPKIKTLLDHTAHHFQSGKKKNSFSRRGYSRDTPNNTLQLLLAPPAPVLYTVILRCTENWTQASHSMIRLLPLNYNHCLRVPESWRLKEILSHQPNWVMDAWTHSTSSPCPGPTLAPHTRLPTTALQRSMCDPSSSSPTCWVFT